MASWDSMITSTLSGLTGVVKAAVIFFVFANIKNMIAPFTTPVNPLNALVTIESHEAMLFLLD